jgi:Terminase small subunit
MENRSMTLIPKHAAFVREYIKDYNGAQAAIRAGYPKSRARKTASEILARPEVKAEVQRRATTITTQVTELTAIDKAWVVSKLVENYERAIGGKQAVDQEGNPIALAPVPNLSAANKALELIGRTLGIFGDRKEAVKTDDLSHLTDEELDRQIVETARGLGFARLEKPETPH